MLTTEAATRKDRRTGLSDMQHRHFATVAEIIWSSFSDRGTYSKEDIAREFADRLKATNPKFDRKRFLRAAIGTSE